MKKYFLCGLILMLLAGSSLAEMRIWRDRTGRQYEGEFSKMIAGDVLVISPRGGKHYVPFSNLSKGDKDYLSRTLVPETEIRFLKETRPKIRSKNALSDDFISIVTGLVKVWSEDEIPNDSLRAEAYIVGEDRVTGKYKIITKASSPLTFNEENEFQDQFQLEGESRYYGDYNRKVRGVIYAGYAAFVLDDENKIINHTTNLPFVTEETFDKFRQLQTWYFFSDKCERVSTPRPEYRLDRAGTG